MTKQEWVNKKTQFLITKEGYNPAQAYAISNSMYERGDHMQEGGNVNINPNWWETFQNPNINLQAQTISPQQTFAPQTTGANIQGSLGNIQPTSNQISTPLQFVRPNLTGTPETPDFPIPMQGQSNADYLNSLKGVMSTNYGEDLRQQGLKSVDPNWQSTQKPDTRAVDEWQRYKLANIYGAGIDTGSAFALTGKYAGEGNTGMAIGAGALSALKGTRDFLTGYGAGKTNKRTYEDYLKSLEKEQTYGYLSETPLQATAQQGGVVPTGVTPNEFATYQTSMQPVYNKADMGDQGLSQLDYYKMLMQSSQTPFVNPPQQPDLSQQVYQESFIPPTAMNANDMQNTMQQGGIKDKDDYYQQGGQPQQSSDVTNAQMMTGAFITDQQNPNVNVENSEFIKNADTQEVVQAVGDTHKDGGIDVNLPQGSQVLSDFTKINKEEAKKFAKDYGVNVSTKDTYASVQDKINNKIGWTKTVKEEEELIKKIEEVRTSSKDENTLNINMKFLQDKYKELNQKKAVIQQEQKSAFDNLFNAQESHTKQGNGELINEDGTPMKKYGGEVYELAKKYNVHPDKVYEFMQEGGQTQAPEPQQIIQAFAQAQGQDPQQVMQQLQQLPPEQQQVAIQQMAHALQGQSQSAEQENPIVNMLNEGIAPEQVVEQLVANGTPQEDAIRAVQAIVSGEQQQNQAPPIAQQGGQLKQYAVGGTTDGNPPQVTIDPRYAFYTPGQYDLTTEAMQAPTYLHQPFVEGYTGQVSGGIDPLARAKYQSEQLPYLTMRTGFVNEGVPKFDNTWRFQKGYDEYLGSVGKAIEANPYLQGDAAKTYKEKLASEAFKLSKNPAKYTTTAGYDSLYGLETSEKGAYRLPLVKQEELVKYPNIKRLSDVLDDKGKVKADYKDLSDETKKVLEDTYKASGVAGRDIGIGAVTPTSAQEAPTRQTATGQNQPITKTAVPVLPSPFVLPPSGLQPVGKWDISLGRVEPSKMTIEPTVAALSQQQLAAQRSNLQNLTPEAAAAANAMLQATVGAQTSQALGQVEEANRQAIYASELQNLQQADKEKLTQAGINEAYQTKMYGAMNNTERDWRNYFKQQSGQDIQNYKDVQAMQLLNAMSPDYQYTGSDVVFSNRPYETAQQKSAREQQAEMLKWYQGLTPAQRAEMQRKGKS